MNSLINKNYIIFYIFIGLALHLMSAYWSYGFYSDDEHFQILEPAAYLLGLNNIIIEDVSGYYWEWRLHIRMRPWLQPYFYYNLITLFKYIGISDPFSWTLTIRILSSLFGFFSIIYLFFTIKKDFIFKDTHFTYFFFFSFWFYPFIHSRSSSENLSFTLFFISFCMIYKQIKLNNFKTNYFIYFISSFILGLSMVVKFNMVFTVIPIFIWITIFKFNIFKIILFCSSVLLALSFGLFIDFINWGSFKNTYLQFYEYNLGEHGRLNDFGIDPWWFFISETILQLAPFLSIFFVLGILTFWIKKPLNIITWISICTILIISSFGHKEIRYIFPIYIFAPFFILFLIEKYNYKYFSKIFIGLIIFSNLVFLSLTLFVPPNTKVGVYKFIYDNINNDEEIYFIEDNPYLINNMEPFFYTSFLPVIKKYQQDKEIKNIWLISNKYKDVISLKKNNCKIKYTTYPQFIFNLNNNWKRLNLNWYILKCN